MNQLVTYLVVGGFLGSMGYLYMTFVRPVYILRQRLERGEWEPSPIKYAHREVNRLLTVLNHSNEKLLVQLPVMSEPGEELKELEKLKEELLETSVGLSETSEDVPTEGHSELKELIHLMKENIVRQLNFSHENQDMSTQILLGIELIADTVQLFGEFSEKATDSSSEGHVMLRRIKEQMEHLHNSINITHRVTEQLAEKSSEIEKILNVIVGISSKINLLALNASIEAARAGDHGRGFSVVAEEVKKLAVQTQDSSKQISGIVAEIQLASKDSFASMQQTYQDVVISKETVVETEKIFEQIVDNAKELSELIVDVNGATEEMGQSTKDFEQLNGEVTYFTNELNEKMEQLLSLALTDKQKNA